MTTLNASLIAEISAMKGQDLPNIQAEFLSTFDGSLTSILAFPKLAPVINPCFAYHYFYVSGDTDENTVTTKHSTGEMAPWGNQSKQAENNAHLLSRLIKSTLSELPLFIYIEKTHKAPSHYLPAIENTGKKRKLFTIIAGAYVRIPGLTTNNINL